MRLSQFFLIFWISLGFFVNSNAVAAEKRNQLEELLIWKMSDELKLSPLEEKKFTDVVRQLNQKKTELNRELQASIEKLAKLFSHFISSELRDLEQWYKNLPITERNEQQRLERIAQIQKNFIKNLQSQLQTDAFKKFPDYKLNNARLLVYKTYMQDLQDFENLYNVLDQDYARFIEQCKSLESAKDPAVALKELISSLQKSTPQK